MSLIAATVISVKNNLPYFLVENSEKGYQFYTAKMHRHNQDTSLGAVLRAFKSIGIVNFDTWHLGELTSVNREGTLMSLYSFEVPEMSGVEECLEGKLEFVPANQLHKLLETLQTTSFVSFEE